MTSSEEKRMDEGMNGLERESRQKVLHSFERTSLGYTSDVMGIQQNEEKEDEVEEGKLAQKTVL